jgi:hypothetical protein
MGQRAVGQPAKETGNPSHYTLKEQAGDNE